MSGEGRGHATRVRALADLLRPRHSIRLYAPGDAHSLLAPAYQGTDVPVHRIPCMRFHYTESGRLHTLRTGWHGARYLARLPRLVRQLEAHLRRTRPDVAIVDFEPALPRAARRCGIPYLSVDHQHFLLVNDLSALPLRLRTHAAFIGLIVRLYHSGMERTVVSSFYAPPLKRSARNTVQAGVILRPSVLEAGRAREGHAVAYLRKFSAGSVLASLRQLSLPVRVYGLGERPPEANLVYKAISEADFVRDLATCEALVTTAGNQLVGEALYLGKPVFAIPEPNNHEQYINAWFLEREGTGAWAEMDNVSVRDLESFFSRLDLYRSRIEPERYNGNATVLATIEEFLEGL